MQPQLELQPLSLDPKAYRFFPNQKQIKTQPGKKGTRFFYFGQITHDQYERKKLGEFHDYVRKNKLTYDDKFFNQQKILLILQGQSYKPEKTLQVMNSILAFRKQYLPPVFDKCRKLLESGYFYPCGRDRWFRPLLVVNVKLVDFNNVQAALLATILVQEQIIAKMMLPGQVESWVLIYDLGSMGLTDLPINALKEVINTVSNNYGGRLHKMISVNAPSSIFFSWKVFSNFMDAVTVAKISFSKTNTDKMLSAIAHQTQFQQKYGGVQPNRTQFWPFKIPPGVFDQARLINPDEYRKMYKDGKLVHNEVDPTVLEEFKPKVPEPTNQEAAPPSTQTESKVETGIAKLTIQPSNT